MKIILQLFLFCVYSLIANAQSEIIPGIYIDDNGNLITDVTEPDYKIFAPLFVKAKLQSTFIPGRYYDLNGNLISGWLKYSFENDKVSFKKEKNSEVVLLTTDICKSYTLGPDSFVAIKYKSNSKTNSEGELHSEFALVLERINNRTFYKSFKGARIDKGTLFMKEDSSYYSYRFEEKLSDDENAMIVFNSDKTTNKIFKTRLNKTDHSDLLALLRNDHKLRNNEELYLDSIWTYVSDSTKKFYYAKVLNVTDSIVKMRFYRNDNSILMEGSFGFDLSGTRIGEFFYYNKEGGLKKKVVYTDNRPDNCDLSQ